MRGGCGFLAQPVSCNVLKLQMGLVSIRTGSGSGKALASKQMMRQRSHGKAHNAIDYRRLEGVGIMHDGFFILPI